MPGLALMLCDLDPDSVEVACSLVAAHPTRWLLVTGAPRGPLWGAVLDAGVESILEADTTLAELAEAFSTLLSGRPAAEVSDRAQLVTAWRSARARRESAAVRVGLLTAQELEVLRLLHVGRTVTQISHIHEVSGSTVRSHVESLLDKLGVHSLLAAVAVLTESQEH